MPTITCTCGTCRKCTQREYMRAYYWRNRDQMLETNRASRQRRIEACRAYDRERGQRIYDIAKHKARAKLKDAVYNGRIKRQSCEVCDDPNSHGHHDDYSKPLEVRWLCPLHHGLEHRRPLQPL